MHEPRVIAVTIAITAGVAASAALLHGSATKGGTTPQAVHRIASNYDSQALPVETINDMTFVDPSAN